MGDSDYDPYRDPESDLYDPYADPESDLYDPFLDPDAPWADDDDVPLDGGAPIEGEEECTIENVDDECYEICMKTVMHPGGGIEVQVKIKETDCPAGSSVA